MPYEVRCVDWAGTAADELGKTLRGHVLRYACRNAATVNAIDVAVCVALSS